MKKNKTYRAVLFRKDTIEEALNRWIEENCEDMQSVDFMILQTSQDGETWAFDSLDDFFVAYDEKNDDIQLMARLLSHSIYFELVFQFGSTRLGIGGLDKHSIERVFSIFEECVSVSNYIEISHARVLGGVKASPLKGLPKEKREHGIDLRVLKAEDITGLAELIFSLGNGDVSDEVRFNTTLFWEDNSSVEVSNPVAIKDEVEKARKKLDEVSIEWISYTEDRRISCNLAHGRPSRSNISVSGCDKEWVSSAYLRLKEFIDSLEKQKSVLPGLELLLSVLIASFVIWAAFEFMPRILHQFHPVLVLFTFVFGVLCTLVISVSLSSYIHNAYPRIELQVGPVHRNLSAMRRKLIIAAITLFVVPILLSLIP